MTCSENREKLKAIFRDTVSWMEEDSDLKEAVEKTKKRLEIYDKDDYPQITKKPVEHQTVQITNERPGEAALDLKKKYPGARVAILNFGNPFEPCGGEIRGIDSREEGLCRISTLYPCLKGVFSKENFYDPHRSSGQPTGSDTLIYTEGIVVCKTDTDFPRRLSKEEWFEVDVITAATPDLHMENRIPAGAARPLIDDSALFGYHLKRAIHIMAAAAHRNVDALVLGAFGCSDEYMNSPHVVANAYRIAIGAFPVVFREIRFAVYGTVTDHKVYDIFESILFPEISEDDE